MSKSEQPVVVPAAAARTAAGWSRHFAPRDGVAVADGGLAGSC